MLKLFFISLIAVCVCPLFALEPSSSVSPWEHSGQELSTSPVIVPGSGPIIYTGYYTREREIYGYRPRFMPAKVSFDKNNRPWLFTQVHPTNKFDGNQSATDSFFVTETAYVQTLDDEGNWIVYDVGQMLRGFFGYVDPASPKIAGGVKHKENVIFGDDGKTIYFGFYDSVRGCKTLIYSYDKLETVKYADINALGIATASIEAFDTFLSNEQYLPTVCNSYRGTSAYVPVTYYGLLADPMGNIFQDRSVVISDESFGDLAPIHSGVMNVTATVGDTVHCVWFDNTKQTITDHTDQYYSNYNKRTGKVSEPVYLGSTFGDWYDSPPYTVAADTHNGPVITVGRDKTVHVVLGGHHSQAKYLYSSDNGKSWSPQIDLPGGNAYNTYPAIITDRDNTVHLVYRCSINGRQLAYSRKKQGQSWEDMGALVVPYWTGHGQYHHNLTVDRLGRLFVTYWYSATCSTGMPADVQAEYDAKWPGQEEQLAHDPVILMSDNGGDTWKIAATADFVDGFIDDTIPVVCALFDSAVDIGMDMADYDNHFETLCGSPSGINGIMGRAVDLDLNDALRCELSQSEEFGDAGFTAAGWFKISSMAEEISPILNASDGRDGFVLGLNKGWYASTFADGVEYVTFSTPAVQGYWTHAAFTYNPLSKDAEGIYDGEINVYINGRMLLRKLHCRYRPSDTAGVILGSCSSGMSFAVDEFGIFKGAMPAEKIAELANNEYRPSNVSRELLYRGDLNRDGKVDENDLEVFGDNWLAGK
jgi:hypothetical protein